MQPNVSNKCVDISQMILTICHTRMGQRGMIINWSKSALLLQLVGHRAKVARRKARIARPMAAKKISSHSVVVKRAMTNSRGCETTQRGIPCDGSTGKGTPGAVG